MNDFVMRMRNAGLKPSPCNCRVRAVNTIAANYLRRGGRVFQLQKIFGHPSLEMTQICEPDDGGFAENPLAREAVKPLAKGWLTQPLLPKSRRSFPCLPA